MFMVFAWKSHEALGGISDLIESFSLIEDAELFCQKLSDSDPSFEYQIVNEFLEIESESGTEGNPFLSCEKTVSN